jgi:hypothetical protein
VSIELFRQRAEECRRLASDARNARDKAFWLGLVERWQMLEIQKAHQPVRDKSRSPLRRQSGLSAGLSEDYSAPAEAEEELALAYADGC